VATGASQNTTTWNQKLLVQKSYFEGSKLFWCEGAGKDIDGDICVEFSETRTRDCISWLTNIGFAEIELWEISTAQPKKGNTPALKGHSFELEWGHRL